MPTEAATSSSRLPEPGGRLLLILRGGIGDVIVVLPAIARLQERFPGSRTTLVLREEAMQIAPLLRGMARVCSDEAFRSRNGRRRGLLWDPAMREELAAFDLIACFYRGTELLNRALETSGCQRVFINRNFDSYVQGASLIHRRQYANAFVDEILSFLSFPLLAVPRTDLRWAQARTEVWRRPGRKLVVVHPGSGGAVKRWPAERFAAVCADLHHRQGLSCLVVGGPTEDELARDVAARAGSGLPFVVGESLSRMSALLTQASLFVGNDSGLTHVAASLNIPTVTVYGVSDAAIWNPWGSPHVLLTRRDATCPDNCPNCPCIKEQESFANGSRPCLEAITVGDVLRGVQMMLDWIDGRHPAAEARASRLRRSGRAGQP